MRREEDSYLTCAVLCCAVLCCAVLFVCVCVRLCLQACVRRLNINIRSTCTLISCVSPSLLLSFSSSSSSSSSSSFYPFSPISYLIKGLWEDEQTRQFYEQLPWLRDLVPAVLLGPLPGGGGKGGAHVCQYHMYNG